MATGRWHGARLAGIAIAVGATLALAPATMAAPNGEQGAPEGARNGPPGPEGNPGAERAQERRAAPRPQAAKPQRRSSRAEDAQSKPRPASRGRGKPAKPQRSSPNSRAKAQSRAEDRGPSSHAKAGKTTICHSTGSATNPYVEITISNNALKAHARHHDGRDIIPAPAGGCESTTAPTAAAAEDRAGTAETNARGDDQAGAGDAQAVAGVRATGRAGDASPAGDATLGGVLGARASSPAPDRAVASEAAAQPVAEEEDSGASLPFTGLALGGLLALAALALTGGLMARRVSTRGPA